MVAERVSKAILEYPFNSAPRSDGLAAEAGDGHLHEVRKGRHATHPPRLAHPPQRCIPHLCHNQT